jgi:hypothetical protein
MLVRYELGNNSYENGAMTFEQSTNCGHHEARCGLVRGLFTPPRASNMGLECDGANKAVSKGELRIHCGPLAARSSSAVAVSWDTIPEIPRIATR